MNTHEATFLVTLADYLVKQGHKAQDITILAMYMSQVNYMNEVRIKIRSCLT